MNLLKFNGQSSTMDEISYFMRKSYGENGNCAGFIVNNTKLFMDHNEEVFKPYPKQVHFMNLLRPQDKIAVVLKPRQCIIANTNIDIYNKLGNITIKELFDRKYRGFCKTINPRTLEQEMDEIIDVWECGKKLIYKITLQNNFSIECSSEHRLNTKHLFKKVIDLTLQDEVVVNDPIYGIYYSKVESIVNTGRYEQTYDLTTKKHHSYLANNIHVHNSGFSTSIVGRGAYEGYFNKVAEVIVVSATRTQAEKVLDRIKKTYKSMHPTLQPIFKTENKQQLELQNGVKFYSLSSNPDSMRGFTGIAYCDEYAIIGVNDSKEIWKAMYPSTTKGGRIVAVSTPNGCDGKFYDLATKSIEELSGVKNSKLSKIVYKIKWQDVPHIVYAVNNEGLFDGMTAEEVEQEYGLSFLTSSEEPYFSKQYCMEYLIDRDGDIDTIYSFEDLGLDDSYFKDFDKPIDNSLLLANNEKYKHLIDKYESFVAGWDIASTNDDSLLTVLGRLRANTKRKEVVAEFKLNSISSDTIKQADFAYRAFRIFGLDQLTLDYTGLGRGVGDYLCKETFDIEESINKFVFNMQSKVDGFSDLKKEITDHNLKRRYDGSKLDVDRLTQMSRLYSVGNRIVGKGGKDDYPNSLMLANFASQFSYGGFSLV